ncbi:ATP-binding protein, partial [Streptomyces somaliensis DSM 40738]|nr:ATP-binding protein [Streptomyces somaliensis DSM 40738]
APAPAPVERPAGSPARNGEAPPVVARTANGLPQRRRRKPLAEPPRAQAAAPAASSDQASSAPATPAPGQEPSPQVQPGMWLAAFQSGLSGEPNDASKGNSQQ